MCPQKMASFFVYESNFLLGYASWLPYGWSSILFELPSLQHCYCCACACEDGRQGKEKGHKELYEQIIENYQPLFQGFNMVLKLGVGVVIWYCSTLVFTIWHEGCVFQGRELCTIKHVACQIVSSMNVILMEEYYSP